MYIVEPFLSLMLLLITFLPLLSFTHSLYLSFSHFLSTYLSLLSFFQNFYISKFYTSVNLIFWFSFTSVMFPIPHNSPITPHAPTPAPAFTFRFPCSVFQACHLICDLCSPLHSADCGCSIMPWLDVMRCLSGSSGAAALGSPVAWIHTTAGGQEWKSFRTTGYPAPFIIPSPEVRRLL